MTSDLVKELHHDLEKKYQLHGSRVDQLWRYFDESQREKAVRSGAAEGFVLASPTDQASDMYKIIPEWNLQDLAQSGSRYFLDHLQHRATHSLLEQYLNGVHGTLGDCAFIMKSISGNGLRHPQPFSNCFSLFIDENIYGRPFELVESAKLGELISGLSTAVDNGRFVPQSIGELILQRQVLLLEAMNLLIEDILEEGRAATAKETRPKKPEMAVHAALSTLSVDSKPKRNSLKDLLAQALDQRNALNDYLALCHTEPIFLAHVVNSWFFSQPELVPDEKGKIIPVFTDKYISMAIVEVIQDTVMAVALWDYMYNLLQILSTKSNDRRCRAIILQEIANACHFEHSRVQKLFKRHVQSGSASKYFQRVSGDLNHRGVRVTMKIQPQELTRKKPLLHYILRLCQPQTDMAMAVVWITKLDTFHRSTVTEYSELRERELNAFGDLAVTTNFVQSLVTTFPLPRSDYNKGQKYISKLKSVESEIDSIKTEIDLSEFATPIDNLLETGMAEGALTALNRFIVDKSGTELRFLYQDLNEECLSNIQNQEQSVKGPAVNDASFRIAESPDLVGRVEQRRQKHKTRPVHSPVSNISPAIAIAPEAERTRISPIFKVKPDTYTVFSTLFSGSTSRGSISWAAFGAAMTDLEFSILPKTGSVYTFAPPRNFPVQQSINLHRPHQPQIEGRQLLLYRRRLKGTFGLGIELFEVA